MVKVIKKILLCPPDHFQIRYQINPWMKKNSVNQLQAQKQWLNLVHLYRKLDIKIATIAPQPHLPDMVFTADQGLIKDNCALLANFRYRQRQPETKIYQDWFKNQGLKTLSLPPKIYFEGGDALNTGSRMLLGYGFRTSQAAAHIIGRFFHLPVIKMRLINPRFYHLDTCLFSPEPQTAFYYPDAFDQKSQRELARIFSKLVPLAKREALGLAANSFAVGQEVITPQGNPIFARQLSHLGYRVHQTPVNEFQKSGGGVHCLTIATQTN